jgi:hypothetical protein
MNPGIDWSDSRAPVWEHPDVFRQACETDSALYPVENDAISALTDADRVTLNSHRNHHILWMGSQNRLRDFAAEAFASAKSALRLGADWNGTQRTGFINLFRSFFPRDEQSLGVFSIVSARRPARFRNLDDNGIVVESVGTPEVRWPSRERLDCHDATIRLGRGINGLFKLPVSELRFGRGSDGGDAEHRFATLKETRAVWAQRFRVPPYYDEMWVCRARQGYDDKVLLRREIPAVDSAQCGTERLRLTPILNLARIEDVSMRQIGGRLTRKSSVLRDLKRPVDYRLKCTLLAVEINPFSGEIFSVRFSFMPLAVVLVNAAPVEHVAICQALRKLLRVRL